MMKEDPHKIVLMEDIEKALKPDEKVEDVAVPIPHEELAKVKKMNRRARKRWLEKNGVTLAEFRERSK